MTSDTQRSEQIKWLRDEVGKAHNMSARYKHGSHDREMWSARAEKFREVADALSTPPKVGSGELDAAGRSVLQEIWDDATNSVCQTMQERKMCNCPDGDCLAAKINPGPADFTRFATLAAPVDHPEVVGVKELEWTRKGSKWSCQTTIGLYVITASATGGTYSALLHGSVNFGAPKFTSLYDAIVHSQADFEARIRSALQPSDSPALDKRGTVCEHGIRWPWACHDCEALADSPAREAGVAEALDDLIPVGKLMANILFNLEQRGSLTAEDIAVTKTVREEWDRLILARAALATPAKEPGK